MKNFLFTSSFFLLFSILHSQDVAFIPSSSPNLSISNSEAASYQPATFKKGPKALKAYFEHNLIYPEKALEYNIQGQVKMLVHMNQKGQVVSSRIVQSLERSCDLEATRAVQNMPAWEPALAGGVAVESALLLTVKF